MLILNRIGWEFSRNERRNALVEIAAIHAKRKSYVTFQAWGLSPKGKSLEFCYRSSIRDRMGRTGVRPHRAL